MTARRAGDQRSREKKRALLGMDASTASSRLKKHIMWLMAVRLNLHTCYRCGNTIDDKDSFSVEHKQSWIAALDPVAAFFDLDNIAFSHLNCNAGAAVKVNKKYFTEEDRIVAEREAKRLRMRRYYANMREKGIPRKRGRSIAADAPAFEAGEVGAAPTGSATLDRSQSSTCLPSSTFLPPKACS